MGRPEVRLFQLSEIYPAADNARTISDEAMAGLATSVAKFGCVDLLVVNVRDDKNIIVGGHQRYKVLLAAEEKEVLCVTVDLDDAEMKLLNITLNNPHIAGKFTDAINEQIAKLQEVIEDKGLLLDIQINLVRTAIEDSEELSDQFSLPDGPRSPFRQVTFTLTVDQIADVQLALEKAKGVGAFTGTGNENCNGNALARVCQEYTGK